MLSTCFFTAKGNWLEMVRYLLISGGRCKRSEWALGAITSKSGTLTTQGGRMRRIGALTALETILLQGLSLC